MPPRRKCDPAKATEEAPQLPLQDEVQAALAWLESKSTQRDRENLARFAINTSKFFGVSMANMKVLAKDLGRDHELAAALCDTGWYEARMLASLVDEPARVTAAQMDRWCRDFDNWAICDTARFGLIDRRILEVSSGLDALRPLSPSTRERYLLRYMSRPHRKLGGDTLSMARLREQDR